MLRNGDKVKISLTKTKKRNPDEYFCHNKIGIVQKHLSNIKEKNEFLQNSEICDTFVKVNERVFLLYSGWLKKVDN
tara:strand:- start:933 stop:1160 length:228 start_codon:yes stop_codon:yes gene_type:complete